MCLTERSPAKVSWLVKFGGRVITTCDTKREAEELCRKLNRKYGLI